MTDEKNKAGLFAYKLGTCPTLSDEDGEVFTVVPLELANGVTDFLAKLSRRPSVEGESTKEGEHARRTR